MEELTAGIWAYSEMAMKISMTFLDRCGCHVSNEG